MSRIKANQIYRAKSGQSFRYIKIEQVRDVRSNDPYALVIEVSSSGETLIGRDKMGMPSFQFPIPLTDFGKGLSLPEVYELVV